MTNRAIQFTVMLRMDVLFVRIRRRCLFRHYVIPTVARHTGFSLLRPFAFHRALGIRMAGGALNAFGNVPIRKEGAVRCQRCRHEEA